MNFVTVPSMTRSARWNGGSARRFTMPRSGGFANWATNRSLRGPNSRLMRPHPRPHQGDRVGGAAQVDEHFPPDVLGDRGGAAFGRIAHLRHDDHLLRPPSHRINAEGGKRPVPQGGLKVNYRLPVARIMLSCAGCNQPLRPADPEDIP